MAAGILPAMTPAVRSRPVLVVEEKAARFDPAKHPRDHDGRFADGPGGRWRIAAGRYRAASVSSLRPGDAIFTGGEGSPGDPVVLPKPVGLTDSVVPSQHRRQRTVKRVEQHDGFTTVHFDDRTMVMEEWANRPVYAPRDAPPPAADAQPKDKGAPDGWEVIGASAKEQEWRNDVRGMYDALLADGVELPVKNFDEYYAKVTARTGKTFDSDGDVRITRQVGKTRVTIATGDLPQEFWGRAADDAEAVVGHDDAKDEVQFAFNASSFKPGTPELGFTNVGADHIQINPRIYTHENVIEHNNLMRSARSNLPRYVLAHEYGHARGAGHNHEGAVERATVHYHGASAYARSPGKKQPVEAAAEAYAEWSMTGGATDNEFTQAVARLEGWA